MHLFTEKTGSENDHRHGDKNKKRQLDIDIGHKADGCRTQNNSIGQGHHAHACGHSYVLNIVGGVGHQIAGFGFNEI